MTAVAASVTIAQLLADAALQLSASDSPRLDAEVLLGHVLKQSRRFFYAYPEKTVDSAVREQFAELLAQRARGVPVAYLTGSREFWSLPLKVTADTLIPRPDTERLVEIVLELFAARTDLQVLDLGTGTGAIALALANEKNTWQITGVDRIAAAVQLARDNAARLRIANVQFLQSDWFEIFATENVSAPTSPQFDVIVSNPPYLADDDVHLAQGDVRFEPRSALTAGADGLADLQHIIAAAKTYLKPGGALFLEHGWQQAAAVRDLLQCEAYRDINTWQDYAGNDRVSGGVWP